MSERSLPERLRLIIARRPKTDAETEATVDDIEKIIRELETLQMNLTRARLRRKANY
jgi:hypothetical protein